MGLLNDHSMSAPLTTVASMQSEQARQRRQERKRLDREENKRRSKKAQMCAGDELDVLREALPSTWRARVYLADGNAFFNRPGPRIVESLEILAACVHPELFEDFAAKHVASFRATSG